MNDVKYNELIEKVKNEAPFIPEFGIILGSGLGDFASSVETIKSVPTNSLPGYPASTVQGHKGFIHFAKYGGKQFVLFQGRIHFYEGYKIEDSILPIRIIKDLGCDSVLLTNAAGGINKKFHPGDLMLTDSFNSINLKSEISKLPLKFNLFNRSEFPSHKLNEIIRISATEEKINLREGVYWYTKGPNYETPAEVQMIKQCGGDAVGMSTVQEAIAAAALGLNVAAISCITNYAAGISSEKLDHNEVIDIAQIVKPKFERLVKKIITEL